MIANPPLLAQDASRPPRRRGARWGRWALLPLLAALGLGGLPCHWLAVPGSAPATALAMPLEQAAGARPQEVRIDLAEWSLNPNRVVVAAGRPVRFIAANGGALPHALAVEGDGLYVETNAIGSADTAHLDVTFAATGIYDLFCPLAVGQHRLLGQEGQLAAVVAVAGETYPRTGAAAEEALTLAIMGPPLAAEGSDAGSEPDPAAALGPTEAESVSEPMVASPSLDVPADAVVPGDAT